MEQETKLPEGLELAQLCCAHASFAGVPDADARTAHEAIRAEHTQRLTLQHHAADLAQRVADLEKERDGLRAQLAELGRQEPVGWQQRTFFDGHWSDWQDCSRRTANILCQRKDYEVRGVYARLVPAIPKGWKLVPVEPDEKMVSEGACASCLPGRITSGQMLRGAHTST